MFTPIRLRALAALLPVATLVCASWEVPAAAQEPSPGGEVRLQILRQPVWHTAGDDLGLGLRVTNDSPATLEGFRLQVRVFAALQSRSELEAAQEIDQSRVEASSIGRDIADPIEPGGSLSVRVDPKLDELASLATAPSGIYPLTVTITDATGIQVLDSVTTFIIFLPTDVESRLKLVPVWAIGELPARGPGDVFEPHPLSGVWHLDEAAAEDGSLRSVLDALETAAGQRLRLGVAATPRTLEELADMADGYERLGGGDVDTVRSGSASSQAARDVIGGLEEILGTNRAQLLLGPYAFPDLPALVDDLERLQLQLREGEAVLNEVLSASPGRGWIFPPAGRLDMASLDDLRGLGAAASTFFDEEALTSLLDDPAAECAPPFAGGTFTCPVSVETLSGRARGYVFDPQLQRRMQALGDNDGRVALQRVFAEIAMIWAELPSLSDRVVPLVIPSGLDLRPQAARLLIRTLGRAPWIQSLTPRGGLHQGIGAAPRTLVEDLRDLAITVDETYQDALDDAGAALDDYAAIGPPTDRLQRLTRSFLVAQSRAWGSDPALVTRGEQYARGVAEEVEDEFGKIRMGGQGDITLTSRAGEIPLVLFNDTNYDVTLQIDLAWADLGLQIERSALRQTFPPGASPLPIEATASSSGIFQVEVTIATPEGREVLTRRISIRSTEFNEIALAITLGALAFLIMFYVMRMLRRRDRAGAE